MWKKKTRNFKHEIRKGLGNDILTIVFTLIAYTY